MFAPTELGRHGSREGLPVKTHSVDNKMKPDMVPLPIKLGTLLDFTVTATPPRGAHNFVRVFCLQPKAID